MNRYGYSFGGRAYERKESDTHLMNQGRYQQLLLSRNLSPQSWESQFATNISLDDLDLDEIEQTLQDIKRNKRIDAIINDDNIEDCLKRLKLMESGQFTNASVVLFTKEPPGDFMQCVLRMARFKGIEKGNFIDSRHVFGNAFQLLREAGNFIVRLWSRHYKGVSIKDFSKLTDRQKAILEVLGNEKLAPSEIFEKLKGSIPERTLRRELNSLKEQGCIDSEGAQGWKRRWFIAR